MKIIVTLCIVAFVILIAVYLIIEYYEVRIEDQEEVIIRQRNRLIQYQHIMCRYKAKLKEAGINPEEIENQYEID